MYRLQIAALSRRNVAFIPALLHVAADVHLITSGPDAAPAAFQLCPRRPADRALAELQVRSAPDKSDRHVVPYSRSLRRFLLFVFFLFAAQTLGQSVHQFPHLGLEQFAFCCCYQPRLQAKGSGTGDPGRGEPCPRHSVGAYLHLYLPGSVVSADSFPLLSSGERWLSAGKRCQRRCTVSIVRGDTWRDLRDSVQVQRGRVRGNTPEGADLFFSHKSEACFFFFFLNGGGLEGRLYGGTFVVGRTGSLGDWRCTFWREGKSPPLQLTFNSSLLKTLGSRQKQGMQARQ